MIPRTVDIARICETERAFKRGIVRRLVRRAVREVLRGRAVDTVRSYGLARPRALSCSVSLTFVVLLLWSGRASAATGNQFISSVSEAPAGTRLVGPGAVAVDTSTGEVFVGDGVAGYVDVFSAAGVYETRFGGGLVDAVAVAVDEASGDVYVVEPQQAAILVYEPDAEGGYRLLSRWSGKGVPGGGFDEVAGVAVDNSKGSSAGDVYVVEATAVGVEGGAVDVFKPNPNPEHPEEVGEGEGEEGVFVRRLAGPKLGEPNGVAVSPSTGRVLVADSFKGAIYAYSPEGVYEEKLTGKGSPYGPFGKEAPVGDVAGLAVDEASGDVYVAEAERHVVSQYSPAGEWEGWITSTPDGGSG